MKKKLIVFNDIFVTLLSIKTWGFLAKRIPAISFYSKVVMIFRFFKITLNIDCPHTDLEMIMIAEKILLLPKSVRGNIVEAGSYKGGSTAKLSIVARMVDRKLIVFDSFQGIPVNHEIHTYLNTGDPSVFKTGSYYGSLREVKNNIKLFGEYDRCQFVKGLFEKTMPMFKGKIAAMFVDVDLISSTKSVLKYLYPKLSIRGVYISHDGHLTFVANLYKDASFWKNEVGCQKPIIKGLGKEKLLIFKKSRR